MPVSRTALPVILCGLAALPAPARADDPPTVSVTGKKEPVVKKLDKTVHHVAGTPKAANGSAQDLLQSTPR